MRFIFSRFFIAALLILSVSSYAYAQTADELRQSIATKTLEIKQLEQEINQYKDDLGKIANLKLTLKNLIASLELTRKKLDGEIRITSTKVDTTDLKIKQLESDITYKQDQVDGLHAAITETVRAISERDSRTLPEVALSRESFSGLWGDLATMGQFNDTVGDSVANLKSIKANLEVAQTQREEERKALLGLKSELSDRKKIAEQTKKEKSVLLAQTSNQESNFAKILKQKIALKDAFEKELDDYEATLKFILDPSSIPPRGKKVFSPPLDNMFVTQNFGKSTAVGSNGQRLYATGTHNGTDFRAPVGTPLKAMQKGVVAGVGDTDVACPRASFGKWVLIRYANGLASVYGHMSLIKVEQGQAVNVGDIVGYSGNTGYSTGPHLHVSVYASAGVNVESRPSKSCSGRIYTLPLAAPSAYLNPMDYL